MKWLFFIVVALEFCGVAHANFHQVRVQIMPLKHRGELFLDVKSVETTWAQGYLTDLQNNDYQPVRVYYAPLRYLKTLENSGSALLVRLDDGSWVEATFGLPEVDLRTHHDLSVRVPFVYASLDGPVRGYLSHRELFGRVQVRRMLNDSYYSFVVAEQGEIELVVFGEDKNFAIVSTRLDLRTEAQEFPVYRIPRQLRWFRNDAGRVSTDTDVLRAYHIRSVLLNGLPPDFTDDRFAQVVQATANNLRFYGHTATCPDAIVHRLAN